MTSAELLRSDARQLVMPIVFSRVPDAGQLEAAGTDAAPDPSVARDIDALLTRYALKNQKQRANGWLNWQINPGQARKAGLEKISLDENTGQLRLTLIRWPELFLLNKLAASRPLHTTLPARND